MGEGIEGSAQICIFLKVILAAERRTALGGWREDRESIDVKGVPTTAHVRDDGQVPGCCWREREAEVDAHRHVWEAR